MSVTTEGSAPTDEMPAGAMTDNGQPSAAAIEMPTGAMTGEATGDMAGAGSITERMGAAAEEMPIGSMLDAAAVTPGIAAGDMPAGDTGLSAAAGGEMPAGAVTMGIDPASAATAETSGEMPRQAAGAAPTSPSIVEIILRVHGT
jgi:hypothetical protein